MAFSAVIALAGTTTITGDSKPASRARKSASPNLRSAGKASRPVTFCSTSTCCIIPGATALVRPYVSLGIGLANIGFFDNQDHHYNQTLFGLPIGIGMKYYWTPWFIFRGDLVDNLAFGGGIDPLTNISLTGGIEIRFGGVRRKLLALEPGPHDLVGRPCARPVPTAFRTPPPRAANPDGRFGLS